MAIGMYRSTLFGGYNIEIFDGRQWKKIEDYKRNERILIFYPNEKRAEMSTPLDFIKQKSKGMNRVTAKGGKMDILLNDDAEFIGKYRDTNLDEYGDSTNRYSNRQSNFTLDEAMHSGKNFGIFSHCMIFNTFNYDFTTNSQLSELKMSVMIQSIMKGRIENNNTCYIDWNNGEFTEREVKKWEALLNKCKIPYTRDNRRKYLYFRLPRSKDVFLQSVLSYSYEEIRFIVDKIDRMCNMSKVIKPKDIDSLDFIQMVYALYGNALAKRKDHLIRINNQGLRLNIKEVSHFRCKYEYGFTVKSGYIIIRNCGYIMVFGDYRK